MKKAIFNSEVTYSFFFSPPAGDLERFTPVSIGNEIGRLPYFYNRPKGWHVEHLIYTLKGVGIAYIGGKELVCKPGTIMITPKDIPYSYRVDPDEGYWEYRWIEFDGKWVRQVWDMMGLAGNIHIPGCLKAEPLIAELFSLVKAEGNDSIHLASAILWRIFATAEETLRKDVLKPSPAFVKLEKVKDFIRENLSTPLVLADLADIANMSQFHFARLFSKHIGMPPMKYLRKLRIARAQELLRRNEMTIGDIGETVGYPVRQHFTTIFKKETGITPGAFVHKSR